MFMMKEVLWLDTLGWIKVTGFKEDSAVAVERETK